MNNVSDDATGVKHTPGPWIIEDDSEGAIWVAAENPPPREHSWTTAKCVGPNARANARLIAAAPDLLAALQALVRAADFETKGGMKPTDWGVYIKNARAAIAKTESRT